ncbi:mechanosensitive ion channel family protein [Kiritimatiella glycovorans]|uniref:MscS family inner membrane protein YnaI n=1 Tax=Kiritimatiella glycovorans TaxID=1307763 RepID=A0A0G3EH30_9BACT|nr:mechanosensitive ion channel family protein [Kiritimatiella glycovorans]AKJ64115.1 MscS family inner membrane protein YnaI [Kiritimatiella glycovorans]
MEAWQEFQVAGNEWWRIAALFGCVLGGLLIGALVRWWLQRVSSGSRLRSRRIMRTVVFAVARPAMFFFFVTGLQAGLRFLRLSEGVQGLANDTVRVLFTISVAYLLYALVDVLEQVLKRAADGTKTRLDDMMVPMVRKSARVTVVVLALVQIAQILSDKPITSILAGLGVGGLAVALAAQDTLKNFFGSLLIFADKPFEMGDRVKFSGYDGPIEEVGFRSTRIRTLEGHLVTIPNAQLANAPIENIGKRPHIRRVMKIGVTYDTPPEKVDRALEIVGEVLDRHEGMDPSLPPRIYFDDFGAFSLDIIVFYWYHPADYWKYKTFSGEVNRELLRRFNEEGIEFAFPTQTLYLAGDENRPLGVDTGPGG